MNAFILPLDNDYSWIQLLTGMNWLVASCMALTTRWHRSYFWMLFSAFLFICSMDEHYMLHECVKEIGLFQDNSTNIIKDSIVLFYGVCSLIGAIYFYKKIITSHKQKILLGIMLFLVFFIVSNDVFNISVFVLQNSAEECAELILSAFTIYFVLSFPKTDPVNKLNPIILTSLILAHFILGQVLRNLVWPTMCPKILLF